MFLKISAKHTKAAVSGDIRKYACIGVMLLVSVSSCGRHNDMNSNQHSTTPTTKSCVQARDLIFDQYFLLMSWASIRYQENNSANDCYVSLGFLSESTLAQFENNRVAEEKSAELEFVGHEQVSLQLDVGEVVLE